MSAARWVLEAADIWRPTRRHAQTMPEHYSTVRSASAGLRTVLRGCWIDDLSLGCMDSGEHIVVCVANHPLEVTRPFDLKPDRGSIAALRVRVNPGPADISWRYRVGRSGHDHQAGSMIVC